MSGKRDGTPLLWSSSCDLITNECLRKSAEGLWDCQPQRTQLLIYSHCCVLPHWSLESWLSWFCSLFICYLPKNSHFYNTSTTVFLNITLWMLFVFNLHPRTCLAREKGREGGSEGGGETDRQTDINVRNIDQLPGIELATSVHWVTLNQLSHFGWAKHFCMLILCYERSLT